jgi:hypothetical protein
MGFNDMKIIFCAALIFMLVTIAIIGLVDSSRSPANASEGSTIDRSDCAFAKITFEGHDYLALNFRNNGHFIHSESCPCKKGNVK